MKNQERLVFILNSLYPHILPITTKSVKQQIKFPLLRCVDGIKINLF